MRTHRVHSVTAAIGLLLIAAATLYAGDQAPFFMGLGGLRPEGSPSRAFDISHDGSTVVGFSFSEQSGTSNEAFRWRADEGMIALGSLPGGAFSSSARGVSWDGSVVVGVSTSGNTISGEAFRWDAENGIMGLGDLPGGSFSSIATAVNADGTVIVGRGRSASGDEAFRWEDGVMVGLGDLPGGTYYSAASGVSADGSVIVGSSASAASNPFLEAFIWTYESGMVGLGSLPGGLFLSEAYAISPEGRVVVGVAHSSAGYRAVYWTFESGMVALPVLEGTTDCSATDVSANGAVIIGGCTQGFFIWDALNGIRDLRSVLIDDVGLDLTGWQLTGLAGISADGLTIAGTGRFEFAPGQFRTEAWIAHIPEPSSLWLFIGAVAVLARRARIRNRRPTNRARSASDG
jgi:probable HAF family extracellular repeat protein